MGSPGLWQLVGERCYILGEGYKAVRIALLLLQKPCCYHRGRICLRIKLTHREEGSPNSSDGKASACNAGDPSSIPGLGRSPEEGNGHPLQYSCLENPRDRGAWQATVHGVARARHDLVTKTTTTTPTVGISHLCSGSC